MFGTQPKSGGSTRGQHKIMYPSYSYLPALKPSFIPSLHCAYATHPDNIDNDNETVVTNNTSAHNKMHGLLDSGASGHFLTIRSKVQNVCPAQNPITFSIPTGTKIKSTKECDLDLPDLPQEARHGHIIPSLRNHDLVSVTKICDAGCDIIF